MQNAKTLLKRLWNEEDGVTIIEYSLLAALIAVAAVAALNTLGGKVSSTFEGVSNDMNATGK
ncbi:MAG: Flp family type IVb pilin [Desulfoplanes sp.]